MTYTKKYGKGWFRESERHRLSRLGIKTGRKNYARGKSDENFIKDIANLGIVTATGTGAVIGSAFGGVPGIIGGGALGFIGGKKLKKILIKEKRKKKQTDYSKITIENGNLNGSIVIDLDEIKRRHPVEALKISNENYHQLYDSGVKLKKNEDTDGDGIINIKDKKPLRPDYSKLSTQQQINSILYNPKKQQTDKEVLTIEIPRDKSQHLKFLKTYTKFKTKGLWKGIEDNNIQIEVEFKDSKDEKYGKRLINLFNTFNKDKIKEDVLYVRTEPVEESSLR